MGHVTRECVMSRTNDEWVMSHVIQSCRTWKTNESCHMSMSDGTHKWQISHATWRFFIHVCQHAFTSCMTHPFFKEWRHRWFNRDTTHSIVTPLIQSWHHWFITCPWVMSHMIFHGQSWHHSFITGPQVMSHMIFHRRRRTDLKHSRLPESNKFSRESP